MKVCDRCGGCFEDAYDLCSYDGGPLRTAFAGKRVLGGRYLLEQRVAGGAMGLVFRATHLQVGSTVAVKIMRPQREGLRVGLQRFWREAQILGQIKHPNAVLVMDFGIEEKDPQPVAFLVTEFLRGQPLSDVLDNKPVMSVELAERIVAPLCEAVFEAHEVGVIHRDLKPSNVFLERLRDGSEIVKVLDFGIAKFVELDDDVLEQKRKERADWALHYAPDHDDPLDEIAAVRAGETPTVPARLKNLVSGEGEPAREGTITEAGFMIGTIPYMAPEQMTGEGVSRQTDVYAIGTLLFQLLAGRLPYDGTDDEIIAGKVSGDSPSLVDLGVPVSAELDAFVQKTLELEPQDRPESVLEIATALAEETRRTARRVLTAPELAERVLAHGESFAPLLQAMSELHARGDDAYEHARDRVLSLLAPLADTARRAERLPIYLEDDERGPLADANAALHEASDRVSSAFRQTRGDADENLDYLRALWAQAVTQVARIGAALKERARPEGTAPGRQAAALFSDASAPTEGVALTQLAERLDSDDALDGTEALDELLTEHGDALYRRVARARDDATTAALVRGLWRHADVLVMQELYPSARAPARRRLLPMLRELDGPGAVPFQRLAALFAAAEGGAVEVPDGDDDDGKILLRCLLAHPDDAVRERALARVLPADVWHVVTHPGAPVFLLRALFDRFSDEVADEYLKVFFLCVQDRLLATADEELADGFALLARFFRVPCFSEDLVFDRLLDLDQVLQGRAADLDLPIPNEADYVASAARFVETGVSDTAPVKSMRDVPLPIQRKLAREGHLISYFACHANDGIAKETLPHLVRLEDVTRYLRLPTLHRAVLTGLAQRRRLLRKESARLALLHNPRTPAHAARPFVPLLSEGQLRLLSHDKTANAEVRQLATSFLTRLKARRA